jgi:hypothetical protein
MRTSGGTDAFGEVAKVTIPRGKAKFTLHARLKRGFRWVLQLESVQKGLATSYSGLRTINVT